MTGEHSSAYCCLSSDSPANKQEQHHSTGAQDPTVGGKTAPCWEILTLNLCLVQLDGQSSLLSHCCTRREGQVSTQEHCKHDAELIPSAESLHQTSVHAGAPQDPAGLYVCPLQALIQMRINSTHSRKDESKISLRLPARAFKYVQIHGSQY